MAEPAVQGKREKLSPMIKFVGIAVVLFGIIVVGIISFLTQPSQAQPIAVYQYMTANYNSSIAFFDPSVLTSTEVNTTLVLPANLSANQSSMTILFPKDNLTHIYFFGADYCAECQVESYVLWQYLTNESFPAYNSNFTVAQFNVPGLPLSNLSKGNIRFRNINTPFSMAQASSYGSNARNQLISYMQSHFNNTEKFLFSLNGVFPGLYVVRSLPDNKTVICSAYDNMTMLTYNASSSKGAFAKYDLKNQTLGTILPSMMDVNNNLNTLASCVEYVDKVQS